MLIVSALFWAITIRLALRTNWRDTEARYPLIALISLTLICTLHTEAIETYIDKLVNFPDTARALKYAFAILLATAWSQACFILSPTESKLKKFIFVLSPVMLLVNFFIWGMEVSNLTLAQVGNRNIHTPYNLAMAISVQIYLLTMIVVIGIPATSRVHKSTTKLALRTRMWFFTATQFLAATLLVVTTGHHTLIAMNVEIYQGYRDLAITTIFIIGSLAVLMAILPANLHTMLTKLNTYAKKLARIPTLKIEEMRLAHELSLPSQPISILDTLRDPYYTENVLFIAIQDYKKLKDKELEQEN